jgi:hypothetical protein
MNLVNIGHWAFVVGLIIAVIAGLGGQMDWLVPALIVLGLIVGFLNVTEKESTAFLVGVIALLVIGMASLETIGSIGEKMALILSNVVTFVAGAGLVVAVKQVLGIAKKSE